jgi:hypothetical protein
MTISTSGKSVNESSRRANTAKLHARRKRNPNAQPLLL